MRPIASPPAPSRPRPCSPAAAPARADACTLDNVPAATLLLPYFEVDPDESRRPTTLFSINNASARAALAHVVLWTDLGVPTLSFTST